MTTCAHCSNTLLTCTLGKKSFCSINCAETYRNTYLEGIQKSIDKYNEEIRSDKDKIRRPIEKEMFTWLATSRVIDQKEQIIGDLCSQCKDKIYAAWVLNNYSFCSFRCMDYFRSAKIRGLEIDLRAVQGWIEDNKKTIRDFEEEKKRCSELKIISLMKANL